MTTVLTTPEYRKRQRARAEERLNVFPVTRSHVRNAIEHVLDTNGAEMAALDDSNNVWLRLDPATGYQVMTRCGLLFDVPASLIRNMEPREYHTSPVVISTPAITFVADHAKRRALGLPTFPHRDLNERRAH